MCNRKTNFDDLVVVRTRAEQSYRLNCICNRSCCNFVHYGEIHYLFFSSLNFGCFFTWIFFFVAFGAYKAEKSYLNNIKVPP